MQWLVGPWIWDTSTGGCWRPPAGFAGLDLRTLPAQGTPGSDPKLSLFFGDSEKIENASDYASLGVGSWADLKPSAKLRAMVPSRRGYTPAGDTLQAILFDLLCNGADPLGFDCHKPLIPDSRMRLELHAGGDAPRSEAFAWGGKHTALIRDVLRADFKDLFLATRNSANPRLASISLKVLDAYCEKYGVAKADWREFVPAELQRDVPGVLPHETTITENFDRADSTSVMGNNLTWTQVTGTWGTTSNKGYKVSTNKVTEWARAESDLSSADHYAQVLIGFAVDTFRFAGPACRFASAAGTHYSTLNYVNTQYLIKHVAGTRTDLSTAAHTYAAEVLKVQSNGSTIKGYAAGSELMSVTDTAITGNTRTGLVSYGNNETFESFQAADLSSPTTATPGVASLTTTRYAPTVRTPRTATPGVKSLTATKYAPAVSTPRLATIGKLSLTATKYAPTASTPRLSTPGVKSLALTLLAPVVSTPRTVTVGVRSLSATLYAPVIATPRTSTPSVASLTLAGFAPTVATPRTATPGVASLTAAGYAPAVLVPRVTVPGVAALSLTSFAPVAATPRVVVPDAAAVAITSYAPVVVTPRTAAPATASITLTAYAPLVSVPRTSTPAAALLVVTTFAPEVAGGSSQVCSPAVRSLIVTRYSPTIRIGGTVVFPGGTFKRPPASRLFTRRTGTARVFARHPTTAGRIFKGYPRMAAILITKLPIDTNETRAFIFDFSQFDEAKAGETLDTATVPAVSGVTIGAPAVLTEDTNFIPAGLGVKVNLSVSSATTYDIECRGVFSGGSTCVVKGQLIGE